jgi:DNA-binding FadR family transcriptional regulator
MIQRKPLREDVQKEILARLIDQRLVPGARVNESHLSAELGVSRTPLREAMLGLEAAGFLGSDVGRGFLIPPLVSTPFREAQQVLARLAPLALALTPPVPQRLMDLQNLIGRARLRATAPPVRAGRRPGAAVAALVAAPARRLPEPDAAAGHRPTRGPVGARLARGAAPGLRADGAAEFLERHL